MCGFMGWQSILINLADQIMHVLSYLLYPVEWLVFPASFSFSRVFCVFRFICGKSTYVCHYRLSRVIIQTDSVATLLKVVLGVRWSHGIIRRVPLQFLHYVLCCRDLFSLALWVRLSYVVGSPQDCAIKSRLMDISFLFRICTCFDLQRRLWDSTALVELGRLLNISLSIWLHVIVRLVFLK